MLNLNEWGDEIVLNLASNLWSVDIVVVPAFKESSHDQGLCHFMTAKTTCSLLKLIPPPASSAGKLTCCLSRYSYPVWFWSSSIVESDRLVLKPGLILLSLRADLTDHLNTVTPSVSYLQVKTRP